MREVTIAGGGLSGLALGIGLRRRGVPVKVLEAGSYPRHRVCGEFICGVEMSSLERLGIAELFATAPWYDRCLWRTNDREILRRDMPIGAWGISRWRMDNWLVERLRELGGVLREKTRASRVDLPGQVWAAGRMPQGKSSRWLGLKCHIRGYELTEPLEMHLGDRGYAGLVEVEDGWVNVCGLFHRRDGLNGKGIGLLISYLEASGLQTLADDVRAAEAREGGMCAVAGFELGRQKNIDDLLVVGDAESMIPPYTGNGMSMAFEAADAALDPLVKWAADETDWSSCKAEVAGALRERFGRRLAIAGGLHGLMLKRWGHAAINGLAKARLLPFEPMVRLTRR